MALKRDLIYRKKNILGIDIGTTSIKIAELKKKNNLIYLTGCGIKEISDNPFNDGVISDPQKTAEEIRELLKQPKWGKITAKRVNISLPEAKTFTRVLELPPLSDKALVEAVYWEADQYIPMPVKDLYLDWEIIETRKKGKETIIEVFMVAVDKKVVDSYLKTMELLDLETSNIEMNIGAISRAMISNRAKDEAILVLDIGGNSSSIAVSDGNIRITGSILFGGTSIIKTTTGKKDEIVFPEIGTLATEVKKLIEYYEGKGEKEERKITKALLCGGSASISGLAEEISKKISLPVEVGNPWVNISTYPLKPVSKSDSPRFANVIGLALKGLIDE